MSEVMSMKKIFLRQVHEKIRNIMTEALFSVKFSSQVFMIPLIQKKRKTEASASVCLLLATALNVYKLCTIVSHCPTRRGPVNNEKCIGTQYYFIGNLMLMQHEKTRKQVAPLCNINNFDDMAPLKACELCRIISHQRCGPNTQIRHSKAKKNKRFHKE